MENVNKEKRKTEEQKNLKRGVEKLLKQDIKKCLP